MATKITQIRATKTTKTTATKNTKITKATEKPVILCDRSFDFGAGEQTITDTEIVQSPLGATVTASMRIVRECSLVVVFAIAVPLAAQQPSSTIHGRVIAADDNRPLRRALVTITNVDERRAVLTDDEGRFELTVFGVAAPVTVSKAGYTTSRIEPVRDRPDSSLEIRLSKGAAISGRVADKNGIPSIGASLRVISMVARSIRPHSRPRQTITASTASVGLRPAAIRYR